jgi:hypothetical protein
MATSDPATPPTLDHQDPQDDFFVKRCQKLFFDEQGANNTTLGLREPHVELPPTSSSVSSAQAQGANLQESGQKDTRSPMEAAAPKYAAKAKRDPNCHRPKLIPQNEFEERIRKQRDKKNARDSERKKRRRQEQHDGVSKAG